MKRAFTASIFLTLILALSSSFAWDPSGNEEDLAKAQAAVDVLLENNPKMQRYFDAAAGYVVIPTVGKACLGIGGARGKGLLYENGEPSAEVTMTQLSFGFNGAGRLTVSSSSLKIRRPWKNSRAVTMNSVRRHPQLRLRRASQLTPAMRVESPFSRNPRVA